MSLITAPNEYSIEGMVGTEGGNQRVVITQNFEGTPITYSETSVECIVEDAQGHKQRCVCVNNFEDSESSPIPALEGGKFLKNNGVTLLWEEALQNKATGEMSVTIEGTASNALGTVNIGTASEANGTNSVSIGTLAKSSGTDCISIGSSATVGSSVNNGTCLGADTSVTAQGAIALGYGAINNEAGTLVVGLSPLGSKQSFKLLNSDGTIPGARLASLPQQDGNYRIRLTISGGVPTLNWVAE